MELFEDVFNANNIYSKLFFNVKAVLVYPNLTTLAVENQALYQNWKYLSKTKYGCDMDVIHGVAGAIPHFVLIDETPQFAQRIYEENAIYYPEYTRIVAITYATVYTKDGQLKRQLVKIVNKDEYIVIATFFDILQTLSSDGENSSPKYFPTLCGYNIINYDIPLLIKRFLIYIDKFEKKSIPLIIKNFLKSKPWETDVVDINNVWKFNGINSANGNSLMLMADYLGLKKTVDVDLLQEVSKNYWRITETDPEKALEYVSLQSATQVNLTIQLINKLRFL